ncbi:MAG: aspartate-semialdehyde dehydrogenase [Spirochaetota bacterium]|nr:MAG: aspartate-semialdehyde dehydrogenase [Spirochaetota bacterium]
MAKIKVAILGATGMVGQRFIEALIDHPFFEVGALVASAKREGGKYVETDRWRLETPLPENIGEMKLVAPDAEKVVSSGVRIAFSALPSDVATELETDLAKSGVAVFSNTASHRMDSEVPLIVPEVNYETIDMIVGKKGYIVTNANCSTTGLVLPLKVVQPLGIKRVFVATYQAISGAGYPGVPSLDILANVIPYIGKEEEKMQIESKKILGVYDSSARTVRDADFEVHASCVRIPAVDGHLEAVEVEVEKPRSEKEVVELFESFESPDVVKGLPTAPVKPVIYRHEPDRPQHRYDVNAGEPAKSAWGMAVSVGRVRVIENYIRFVVISHNTRRGAAPGSVLNAELAHKKGYL